MKEEKNELGCTAALTTLIVLSAVMFGASHDSVGIPWIVYIPAIIVSYIVGYITLLLMLFLLRGGEGKKRDMIMDYFCMILLAFPLWFEMIIAYIIVAKLLGLAYDAIFR